VNAGRIDLSGHPRRPTLHTQKVLKVPDESKRKSVTYADAGVDISRGDRAKERIKFLAQKTFNRNVLGGIGGFGALFRLDLQRWKNPILVSSADGVGTKLKVAFELGLHGTVGADLVNHCVNDIAVQGATPLFFLDYLATGLLDPEVAESVVTGLADACRANGCALIGGETAQKRRAIEYHVVVLLCNAPESVPEYPPVVGHADDPFLHLHRPHVGRYEIEKLELGSVDGVLYPGDEVEDLVQSGARTQRTDHGGRCDAAGFQVGGNADATSNEMFDFRKCNWFF